MKLTNQNTKIVWKSMFLNTKQKLLILQLYYIHDIHIY